MLIRSPGPFAVAAVGLGELALCLSIGPATSSAH
jgi:hypothetical protein